MNRIDVVRDYFKYFKNPISALMFKFNLKNSCEVKLKNHPDTFKIEKVEILDRLINKLPVVIDSRYDEFKQYIDDLISDKEILVINNLKYVNVYSNNFQKEHHLWYNVCYDEYFSDDEWNMVDFRGRDVIDIGGNAADTALVFASDGANVIAFEPVKHLYDLALMNISINEEYKNQIRFINNGVGGKRGKLELTAQSLKDYADVTENYEVEVITVSDILDKYQIKPDILKIDCEGCEFEIIKNEDLSMFKDIVLEHHAFMVEKDSKLIIDELKRQGFNVNTYECRASRRKFEEMGFIHAYK